MSESALPLVVRVDWETGVDAVHEVPKLGVERLLVHDGAVWAQARLGAFRLLSDGSVHLLNVVGRIAASGSAGVWIPSADGFLLRVGSAGRVVATVARLGFGAGQLVSGERLIWLALVDGRGRPLLAGHDAVTGRRRVAIDFEGQVDPLGVAEGIMWVKTTRLDNSGRSSRWVVAVVGIDERTGKEVSRAPIPLGECVGPAGGLLWRVRDEYCRSPNEDVAYIGGGAKRPVSRD